MADDPVASVDLFQEDHPHQLMRKCHFRKRQQKITTGFELVWEPARSADQKTKMAVARRKERLYPIGQAFAGKLLSL